MHGHPNRASCSRFATNNPRRIPDTPAVVCGSSAEPALSGAEGHLIAIWMSVLKRRFSLQRGFSAIEMLVVTAIFAIGSVVVAATYVNFTRLHRRVANAELLGEELRFVNELLVRAARNNVVNYPALPTAIVSPTSSLSLISLSAASTTIVQRFATSSSVCSGLNAACLGLSVNNGASWTAVTGRNVAIDRFQVYVTPVRSPFQATGIGTYNNDNQPRITFMIDASYNAANALERASLSSQTSVSNRVYLR